MMKPPLRHYKILFVLTPAFIPNAGGVQMSTAKMGRHFAEHGHQVAVFSLQKEGHQSCSFGRLFASPALGGSGNSANLEALERCVQDFAPDIVINQMPYEFAVGEVLKANKRYLLLGCLRNTLYSVKSNLESYVKRTAPGALKHLSRNKSVQNMFLQIHRIRHRAELKKILETYDLFVMFGPPNLEELGYFIPNFDPGKIKLIPNSIPSVATTVPQKEKRILWLGRIVEHQKRAELILPVWQRVSHALPDWELDVVGDGPLLEELKRRVRQLGLERVQFHGRQIPDEFYRRAATFFMTSAFEGFPNTLVEAQSHAAIPVVFDSYPVAKWIVEDGQNGHLVDPFDVDAMAERIISLANLPERQRFAQKSLESAHRFHIERVGQMWQELFNAEVPLHVKPPESQSAA